MGRCLRGKRRRFFPNELRSRSSMTHPSIHARTQPNKIAYQMAGSGKAISYRELDELSNQGAHLFRSLGLNQGDHIAFLIENRLAFMEICWAAQRSGLYLTDRKSCMIMSGGVNIYPQEAEDVLITHADVADVAVF